MFLIDVGYLIVVLSVFVGVKNEWESYLCRAFL